MAAVTLHRVADHNRAECEALRVGAGQAGFVAPVSASLREAAARADLHSFAVYDARARGWERPAEPVVGFAMYELAAGVGFVYRLMIDARFQGRGYGRAAMAEMVRRLALHPEVELIAASHRRGNDRMAGLLRSLGFIDWEIGYAAENPDEVFLRLAHAQAADT